MLMAGAEGVSTLWDPHSISSFTIILAPLCWPRARGFPAGSYQTLAKDDPQAPHSDPKSWHLTWGSPCWALPGPTPRIYSGARRRVRLFTRMS